MKYVAWIDGGSQIYKTVDKKRILIPAKERKSYFGYWVIRDEKNESYFDTGFCPVKEEVLNEKIQVMTAVGLTNNESEYMALVVLLHKVPDNSEILVHSDSTLVVNQMQGKWKIKDNGLYALYLLCTSKIKEKNLTVKFNWISRDINMVGRYLERHKDELYNS